VRRPDAALHFSSLAHTVTLVSVASSSPKQPLPKTPLPRPFQLALPRLNSSRRGCSTFICRACVSSYRRHRTPACFSLHQSRPRTLPPISIHAPRPPPRTIMRVMNHPINHRRQMLRDAHHQSPGRQFVCPQMHRTSRPDLHRRRPFPAQRFHHPMNRTLVHARPRIADSALPFPGSLSRRRPVHPLVNLLIRPLGGNRNRPHHAIPRLPPVPRCRPSPIIKPEMCPRLHLSPKVS